MAVQQYDQTALSGLLDRLDAHRGNATREVQLLRGPSGEHVDPDIMHDRVKAMDPHLADDLSNFADTLGGSHRRYLNRHSEALQSNRDTALKALSEHDLPVAQNALEGLQASSLEAHMRLSSVGRSTELGF